jgi:hypothetical protein
LVKTKLKKFKITHPTKFIEVQNGVKIEGKKSLGFFKSRSVFRPPLSIGFWRDLCGQTVKVVERAGSSIFNASQILLSPPLKNGSLSQSCLPVCGNLVYRCVGSTLLPSAAGVPALPRRCRVP